MVIIGCCCCCCCRCLVWFGLAVMSWLLLMLLMLYCCSFVSISGKKQKLICPPIEIDIHIVPPTAKPASIVAATARQSNREAAFAAPAAPRVLPDASAFVERVSIEDQDDRPGLDGSSQGIRIITPHAVPAPMKVTTLQLPLSTTTNVFVLLLTVTFVNQGDCQCYVSWTSCWCSRQVYNIRYFHITTSIIRT